MKYAINDSTLIGIADAIRTQLGESDSINPLDMADAILAIEGGGGGGYDSEEFEMTFSELTSTVIIPTSLSVDEIDSIECFCNGTPPNNANYYIRDWITFTDRKLNTSKEYDTHLYATYWSSNDINATFKRANDLEETPNGIKVDFSDLSPARYYANNGCIYTFVVRAKSGIIPSESKLPRNMAYGEIELTENLTESMTIEHNIGKIPNYFFIWADGATEQSSDNKLFPTYTSICCFAVQKNDGSYVATGAKTWIINNSNVLAVSNYGGVTAVDSETITIATRANTYPWRSGINYRWVAVY